MSKRKFDSLEEDHEPDRALRIQKSRLAAKITQGTQALHSALKLARGFERQKLGRRQKAATNEPKTLLRLREEVILLKGLDLADVARGYLVRCLGRIKRVREARAYLAVLGGNGATEGGKERSKAEADVVARLFNSNPVREVMPGIVKGVYAVLGLDISKKTEGKVESGRAAKGEAGDEVAPDDDGGESDGDSFASFDDRLHASSGEDTDEADDANHERLRAHIQGTNSRRGDATPSLSRSTSRSSSESPLETHHKSSKPAIKPSPPSQTAFLPSLMMGGYYSGSESGSDVDIDDKAGRTPQRKNRRGQRARQQIAEKKYGAKAKHLQSQKTKRSTLASRDSGWDAKKGATESNGQRKRGYVKGRGFRGNNTKGPTGANETVVVDRKDRTGPPGEKGEKSDGPLHPSWEAAKKRKQQSQSLARAFAGKKITFD